MLFIATKVYLGNQSKFQRLKNNERASPSAYITVFSASIGETCGWGHLVESFKLARMLQQRPDLLKLIVTDIVNIQNWRSLGSSLLRITIRNRVGLILLKVLASAFLVFQLNLFAVKIFSMARMPS